MKVLKNLSVINLLIAERRQKPFDKHSSGIDESKNYVMPNELHVFFVNPLTAQSRPHEKHKGSNTTNTEEDQRIHRIREYRNGFCNLMCYPTILRNPYH